MSIVTYSYLFYSGTGGGCFSNDQLCLTQKATENNDFVICNRSRSPKISAYCITYLALKNGDEKLCEKTSYYKEQCYKNLLFGPDKFFSIELKPKNSCSKLPTVTEKNKCKISICNQMKSSYWRKPCLTTIFSGLSLSSIDIQTLTNYQAISWYKHNEYIKRTYNRFDIYSTKEVVRDINDLFVNGAINVYAGIVFGYIPNNKDELSLSDALIVELPNNPYNRANLFRMAQARSNDYHESFKQIEDNGQELLPYRLY